MLLRSRIAFAVCALFVAATLAAYSQARADDAMAAIKARGKMVVGIKTDYPPFGFLDGEHNVGIEIDILHNIAKDLLGNPDAIDFVPVVSANRFQYLNTNKVDFLMATVTVTDARKKVVDFAAPDMKSGSGIMILRSNQSIHDAPDLAGKTVVVVPGSTGEDWMKRANPTAKLLVLPQTAEALQAVSGGRADAFVQDSALLVGLESTLQGSRFKVVGKDYEPLPAAATCRKGDSAICDYISKEIAKFDKAPCPAGPRSGNLSCMKAIYHKWIATDPEKFMP
jgi:polar amino acid transport system substrate-binding protein